METISSFLHIIVLLAEIIIILILGILALGLAIIAIYAVLGGLVELCGVIYNDIRDKVINRKKF